MITPVVTEKSCLFCTQNIKFIDWKQADLLRKFMTPQGKIASRRRTGTCAFHQRKVAKAIKRARAMALVPYVTR